MLGPAERSSEWSPAECMSDEEISSADTQNKTTGKKKLTNDWSQHTPLGTSTIKYSLSGQFAEKFAEYAVHLILKWRLSWMDGWMVKVNYNGQPSEMSSAGVVLRKVIARNTRNKEY